MTGRLSFVSALRNKIKDWVFLLVEWEGGCLIPVKCAQQQLPQMRTPKNFGLPPGGPSNLMLLHDLNRSPHHIISAWVRRTHLAPLEQTR